MKKIIMVCVSMVIGAYITMGAVGHGDHHNHNHSHNHPHGENKDKYKRMSLNMERMKRYLLQQSL